MGYIGIWSFIFAHTSFQKTNRMPSSSYAAVFVSEIYWRMSELFSRLVRIDLLWCPNLNEKNSNNSTLELLGF